MKHASKSKAGVRLSLDADLTIYNAGEQKHRLLEALQAARVLELDLSGVGEVDTAGIQLLILAKRESLRLGHELRIVSHSPAVRDLIDFYNIGGFFGDPLLIPAGDAA